MKKKKSQLERAIIIKPRRVKKGALNGFKNTLHELVPELKNLTDEDLLESIIVDDDDDIYAGID